MCVASVFSLHAVPPPLPCVCVCVRWSQSVSAGRAGLLTEALAEATAFLGPAAADLSDDCKLAALLRALPSLHVRAGAVS